MIVNKKECRDQSMRWVALTSIILLMVFQPSCKSLEQKSPPTTHNIILLMSEGMEPQKTEALRDYTLLKSNRISRSQNMWMITIETTNKIDEILAVLRSSSDVTTAEPDNSSIEDSSNSTNSKKAKTKPIKTNPE